MSQGSPYLLRAKYFSVSLVLTATVMMLVGALPAVRAKLASLTKLVALQSGGTVQITMSPNLYPDFNPNITDYVVSAGADSSVQVTVNRTLTMPPSTRVSVDGQTPRKPPFTATVKNITPGQRFTVKVNSQTYHVRRLPSDFPAWTAERPGTPQSEYYIFAPSIKVNFSALRNYVTIADNNGVPVWWIRKDYSLIDAKLFDDNTLGWLSFARNPPIAEVRGLDASPLKTFLPDEEIGGSIDNHEFLLLPNGNYLFIVNIARGPVDLSPYGGPVNGQVLDHELEEFTPAGKLIWHWSTFEHVPVSETDPNWRFVLNSSVADAYHINSVEFDGSGYIMSMRHMDAVIRIDRATGRITWKLGGVNHLTNLRFVGDRYRSFGGQHDARILPDGTLTVHDNGTLRGRAPRAVRYRLDTQKRTATLIEQVTDPRAPSSGCCGSARKLPTGNWVTEWGQNPSVTELAPDGKLVFRIQLLDSWFSYRAFPVPFGQITREQLREGMDLQFPR